MRMFEILLIAVGLSLDVLAYGLYKGAMMPEVRRTTMMKLCIIFSVWQTISILAGCLVGTIPKVTETAGGAVRWQYCSAAIFWGLGIYMIGKARRRSRIVERKEEKIRVRQIVIVASITSVDAFIAGIGFGFLQTDIMAIVATVAAATCVSMAAGVCGGYWLGCQFKNRVVALGGCILVLGGLELLIRRVG